MVDVDENMIARLAAAGVRVRPLGFTEETRSGRYGQWCKNESEAIEADHVMQVLSLLEIYCEQEPRVGDVWGKCRNKSSWRTVTAIYPGMHGPCSWVLYGDETFGGGMLPIPHWYEWAGRTGAKLLKRKDCKRGDSRVDRQG